MTGTAQKFSLANLWPDKLFSLELIVLLINNTVNPQANARIQPASFAAAWFISLLLLGCSLGAYGANNLVSNPGFESGLGGWRVWSRKPDALTTAIDDRTVHSGRAAVRLEHRGNQDWSLEPTLRLDTKAGDLIQLECWVRVEGSGSVTLCASTWDGQGKVLEWSAGEREAFAGSDWQHLVTRVVASEKTAQIQPRLIGYGVAAIWVDDFAVGRGANLALSRPAHLPGFLVLSNTSLSVTFDTTNATLSVEDFRSNRRWIQKPFAHDFVVKDARLSQDRITCALFHAGSGLDFEATFQLAGAQPELLVQLTARGELPASLRFPHPFTGEAGDYLVVPMNEGISYPIDDPSISPMRLIAYGGHGICMAFYGLTDGQRGQMAILETPDDVSIRVDRLDGKLVILPEWDPQHGQFGYARRIRYVFFDRGGHVAMAKRYRAYAKQTGLFKTLAEKRDVNPKVDRLIGAVNVWCWDRDAVGIVKELQSAGIDRILWSNQQPPDHLKALNELGVLTSRYDIYQDVMAPTNFARLRWIHPDWTSNAWSQEIILDRRGNWLRGWGVESRDGSLIPCGVLCDRFALQYARERVPPELASHPYLCRFIDTTTAAPWNECYSPVHPMTRTDSKKAKMELLRYFSETLRLVTGSETGHDAVVPYVHYFEGMMSLGPYRVPDAGRRMSEIWTNVPEVVAQFQLGQQYRLPLWELVYHDCVVAHWYWGDYNNKLPSLWDKRDLFNVLYGVPPMFMFDRRLWEKQQARFVASYRNTCPVIRRVGYQEMIDHQFLTPDRAVQQTRFANGITVTVNFGAEDYQRPGGRTVKAMGFAVDGE